MDTPVSPAHYVELVTAEPLDKAAIRAWYACVREAAPSGTLASLALVDPRGRPRTVVLVHRDHGADRPHVYRVPLSRDLTHPELRRIVAAWAAARPELDWQLTSNVVRLAPAARQGIDLDQAAHLAFCLAVAQQQHADWLRERTDAGWRYGMRFDAHERTHPLLRPWDELPARYRRVDLDLPQRLVSLLGTQGYTVVKSEELHRLLADQTRRPYGHD